MEAPIDEKKVGALYKAIRANKELGSAYENVDETQFRTTLETNPEYQDALHKDLVSYGLISPDINIDRFRSGLGVKQVQVPATLKPAQPPSQAPSLTQVTGEQAVTPNPSIVQPTPEPSMWQKVKSYGNDIAKSIERGWKQGKAIQTNKLTDLATGTAANIDFDAMAKANKEVKDVGSTATEQDFQTDEGVWDNITDYAKMALPVMAESITTLIRSGAEEVGTGATTGAAVGSVVPGAGTLAGAATGATAGTAMAGYNMELYASIMDELEAKGVDISDPNQLRAAFSDKKAMAPILEKANTRAAIIGAVDLVGGVAGNASSRAISAARPLTKTGRALQKVAKAAGKLDEVATGAGGEAAAQYATTGQINPQEVALEALGEAPVVGAISKLSGVGAKPPVEPPTQLGGIPTQPVPPDAPFTPETPTTEVEYVTVTPEELDAFKQGQVDPGRAAGIADDIAAIEKGELILDQIDDPNYRQMVEITLQSNETVPIEQRPAEPTGEVVESAPLPAAEEVVPVAEEEVDEIEVKNTSGLLDQVKKLIPVTITDEGGISGGTFDIKTKAIEADKKPDVTTPSTIPFLPKTIKLAHITSKKLADNILKNGFKERPIEGQDHEISGVYFTSEPEGWRKNERYNVGGKYSETLISEIDNDGLLYFDDANSLRNFLKEKGLPSQGETLTKDQMDQLRGLGIKGIVLREDLNSQTNNELIVLDKSIIKNTKRGASDETTKIPSSFESNEDKARAYLKAKRDGTSPELVKAVEDKLAELAALQSNETTPLPNQPIPVAANEASGTGVDVEPQPVAAESGGPVVEIPNLSQQEVAAAPAEEEVVEVEQTLPKTPPKEMAEGFTEGPHLSKITKDISAKLGNKAKKYFEQVNRLFNPNKVKIIEYRTNGVITEENGRPVFNGLGDTDFKNWRVSWRLYDDNLGGTPKQSTTEPSSPQKEKSDFSVFDPPSEGMTREEGRKARAALKEKVGKTEFAKMESIHKKAPEILRGLEKRGVLQIICP